MCAHKELEYLGRQYGKTREIAFYLYNCRECQTTISSRIKISRNRRNAVLGVTTKMLSLK